MAADTEKTLVSMRVPADICGAFDRIASLLDRDRTWVMVRAFRQYLEEEGDYILREAAGLAALNRGEGVDFDDVIDEIDDMITQRENRHLPRQAG
jgi:predicted transcriptional regulator